MATARTVEANHRDASPAFRTAVERDRPLRELRRPRHRVAHHPHDHRRHLGGRGPPLLPRSHHLGLRRGLHDVRHALHAGHRLHPDAHRARAHRHALFALVHPPPEPDRRDRLLLLLLPGDDLPVLLRLAGGLSLVPDRGDLGREPLAPDRLAVQVRHPDSPRCSCSSRASRSSSRASTPSGRAASGSTASTWRSDEPRAARRVHAGDHARGHLHRLPDRVHAAAPRA